MTQAVTPYLIALGIGLLVGLERECHKVNGPDFVVRVGAAIILSIAAAWATALLLA